MLKEARENLALQENWIKTRRAHIDESLAGLNKDFNTLLAQDKPAAAPAERAAK